MQLSITITFDKFNFAFFTPPYCTWWVISLRSST